MAFQTNVFRDGQWITETITVEDALRHTGPSTKQTAEAAAPDRPPCGILTTTVVESPMVHKILPVRIRSKNHNDIAFIGSNAVSIRELRNNGQTYEILKYTSPGSRIRNAVVLGDCPDDGLNDAVDSSHDRIDGLDSIYNDSAARPREDDGQVLPPQMLVIVLENSQLVFLFTAAANSPLQLRSFAYDPPFHVPYHGHHLVVDPSFRYMASAPFEDLVVVYELESLEALNLQYRATGQFPNPIKATRFRTLRGTIHDVQFLYPRPQDDYHIIMMVVISSKRSAPERAPRRKYIAWDWEAGEDLRTILSRQGHRQSLSKLDGVPLFSIPLKSQNAFFIVYEDHIAIVRQSLSSGEYDSNRVLETPGPSPLHHGARPPLWVSWARPFRRKEYSEKTDIIYLAREDGIVFHIEIDSDTLLYSGMELGCSGTNIGTAFTAAYDKFSDLLIIGGESSPGGIWKLAPRSELEHISTFVNWSPVTDMAMTRENRPKEHINVTGRHGPGPGAPKRPDRVFLASGRGETGCIVELRAGLRARIGLEMDIGEHAKQAWLFSDGSAPGASMHALLALPHSTAVLNFSSDFGDVSAESDEATQFNTASRTLHAARTNSGLIAQVTEESITLVANSQCSNREVREAIGAAGAVVAEQAFCFGDSIAIAVQESDEAQLHVLHVDQMNVVLGKSWNLHGEITCLSQFTFSGKQFVLVGSISGTDPTISVYSTDGELIVSKPTRHQTDEPTLTAETLDPLSSICVVQGSEEVVDIIAGTRLGSLLTIRISHDADEPLSCNSQKIGSTSVDVFPAPGPMGDEVMAFATCDSTLIRLSGLSPGRRRYTRKDAVWATDASDPSLPAPPIRSIFTMRSSIDGPESNMLALMLSGTNLLVADIEPRVGSVPRTIKPGWKGTPTRIIYSSVWDCLVVGLQTANGIDLALVDPESGQLVSKSLGKDRNEGQLVSFGTRGDRILGLHEWIYDKDGQEFHFIVVTTQEGKVVVMSVARVSQAEESPPYRRLEHWTRYRRKVSDEPVYSVVPDEQGLVYATGRSVHRDILDLDEKKMKVVKQHHLESPAVAMEIVDGKLFALTTMHSVEVLDYRGNPGSTEMTHLHSDRVSRSATHMITIGDAADKPNWPVLLISDVTGGISGVWANPGAGSRELAPVFEGQLGNSIRKFVRGRCRPSWQSVEQGDCRFGSLPSSEDGSEILGVSLDGTLRHFRLLGIELWRFLALIQLLFQRSLASGNPEDMPYDVDGGAPELEVDPENMHIQGDTLMHVLANRNLEKLVREGECVPLFCRYLDEIEGGLHTSAFRDSEVGREEMNRRYLELGYEVLEYLLASPL